MVGCGGEKGGNRRSFRRAQGSGGDKEEDAERVRGRDRGEDMAQPSLTITNFSALSSPRQEESFNCGETEA